jgi:hypothetical protein
MYEMHDIDLWRDGVGITLNKLCANNGIDIDGMLAFDMPSDGSIGRVGDGTGDLHVELADLDKEDEAGWSAFSGIAPETRAPEPEPADTDPPFDQNAAIFGVPGLFGTCLKSYGEAFACVAVHGYATDNIRDAFKAMWGITEDDMSVIDRMMPVARSTGDAFWGGWSRNLNPANFTMPATQAAVKVKFHNVSRTTFGKHALVDWPRVKAMAAMIGCRVLADDRYVRGRVKRIDFAIDPREVINAPADFVFPKFKVTSREPNEGIKFYYIDHAIAFLNNSTSAGVGQSRFNAGDTVVTEVPFEIPRFTIYGLIAEESSMAVNVPLILRDADPEGTEDLWVRSKRQDMSQLLKRNQYVDVEQVLKAVALGNLSRGADISERGFMVRQLSEDLKDGNIGERKNANKRLKDLVRKIWSANILEAVMGYGNAIEPNHGGKLVGQIITRAGERHGIMQEHNLRRLWEKMIDVPNILSFLGSISAKAINARDRVVEPIFVSRYLDMLASSGDFEQVLNNMFAARKRYWSNRYYRTAKSCRGRDDVRSVTAQLMSKAFKHLTFRVAATGVVTTNIMASIQAFNDSVVHFIRKRNKNYQRDTLTYNMEDFISGVVDVHISLSIPSKVKAVVKWGDVMIKFTAATAEFETDIRNFVWRVTHMSAASAVPIDEDDPMLYDDGNDDYTDEESDEDDEAVTNKGKEKEREFETHYTHPIVPSVPVVELGGEEHNSEQDDSFDDWDIPVNATAGMVSLIDELAEDLPGSPVDYLLNLAEKYGKLVHVNDYEAIMKEAREGLINMPVVSATGLDVDNTA